MTEHALITTLMRPLFRRKQEPFSVPGERVLVVLSAGNLATTQAVVRDWLAGGAEEVCVAVADVQTEGRGRLEAGDRVRLRVGVEGGAEVAAPSACASSLPARSALTEPAAFSSSATRPSNASSKPPCASCSITF